MSLMEFQNVDGHPRVELEACRAAGRSLAARYRGADPFPHIVIDDFMDQTLAREVVAAYPSSADFTYFDRDQERLKYQYSPDDIRDGRIRSLLLELNSAPFLAFLEEMTGIDGLIPDPHFMGGGLHETKRGGHLGIHADFNIHADLHLERRLNLLIYLNEDWDDSYGGKLELWDREMKACEVSVAPTIGKAVVFNTDLDSFHGHPDPLTCPPERSRRSIATYYYTADPAGLADRPKRTTNFRPRPDSSDATDWNVWRKHFIHDWVPPRLLQLLKRRETGN